MPRRAQVIACLACLISLSVSSLPAKSAELKKESAIGRKVAPFSLGDFRGKSWSLADFQKSKVVVVAF